MKTYNTYNILLVEDDEVDIMNIQRAFKKANIANPLIVAENGLEALDILKGNNGKEKIQRPYVILLDINMPKMNGLEFLEVIRNDPTLQSSPVVVLTSSERDEDICQSYEKQVAGYLTKPVSLNDFIEKMAIFGKYWTLCEIR
jgi:CheY-like chemotaxis protein